LLPFFGLLDDADALFREKRYEHGRRAKRDKYHPSGIEFFIMVSFPEEAAVTICFSIELLIFALKSCQSQRLSLTVTSSLPFALWPASPAEFFSGQLLADLSSCLPQTWQHVSNSETWIAVPLSCLEPWRTERSR